MRHLRLLALATWALAACTYPEKQYAGPFACLGQPPPRSAAPLVQIAGETTEPLNLTPIPGVSVALQDQMTPIAGPVTTDANGSFSFSLNTNGTPVDNLDLYASAPGRIASYYFPSSAVTADLTVGLAVLSMQEQTALASDAGLQFTAGDGHILLNIEDCNGNPIAGATLAASPAGTVRYFDGVHPSMTATATDAGAVAMVANLPPGKVTLTATAGGMQLPPLELIVVASSFSITAIQP